LVGSNFHLSAVLTILLLFNLIPFGLRRLHFCGLCAISVGIFTKGIRLLVKSLIVGTLIEFWSRTLVAPFYKPRCPPLAPMVFVDIILDFVRPCISRSCLFNDQLSSSARQYFLPFRILTSQTKSIDLRDNIGPPSLWDHSLAQESFSYHVKAAFSLHKR
jgi:hypothetical protein